MTLNIIWAMLYTRTLAISSLYPVFTLNPCIAQKTLASNPLLVLHYIYHNVLRTYVLHFILLNPLTGYQKSKRLKKKKKHSDEACWIHSSPDQAFIWIQLAQFLTLSMMKTKPAASASCLLAGALFGQSFNMRTNKSQGTYLFNVWISGNLFLKLN